MFEPGVGKYDIVLEFPNGHDRTDHVQNFFLIGAVEITSVLAMGNMPATIFDRARGSTEHGQTVPEATMTVKSMPNNVALR